MALLDILKKKRKPIRQAPASAKATVGRQGKEEKKPAPEPVRKPVEVRPKKISGIAYKILKKPHVAEKATDLTSKNQYVFEVFPESNKIQIKKAVEELYGVDVVNVRIINIPRKKRRLGRIEGWRSGYKKAIVKIKEGQKIEVLPR